jgi:hypothetical protein
VVGVTARRLLGDLELCGGGEEPAAADDLCENARLGKGQPIACGKALDLGAKAGGGIGDENGGGRPVDVEDRQRAGGGKRDDMGEKRRGMFASV